MAKEIEFPVELAVKIVDMLYQVTNNNVNFMDKNGVIIATKQPERLGAIHEGARRIMSGEMDELSISAEHAQKLNGVLPGYNRVVIYKGVRIGCLGLSGDPNKMCILQKMAEIILREEYDKYIASKTKREIIEKVSAEIRHISATIDEIATGSIKSYNESKQIEEMANCAEKYINNINVVLSTIKDIIVQTTLLGLNAKIEAAHAGEKGKGFGQVALEIGRLSTNSADSLKSISRIIDEIQSSTISIAERIRVNTSIAQQQSTALQNISTSVARIQIEAEKLVEPQE